MDPLNDVWSVQWEEGAGETDESVAVVVGVAPLVADAVTIVVDVKTPGFAFAPSAVQLVWRSLIF
jgi:hypothetical protein